MEHTKWKNKLSNHSGSHAFCGLVLFLALCCYAACTWSVLARYYNSANPDNQLLALAVVNGTVIISLLLCSLATFLFGKKTPILTGIFSIPVFLYYGIERIGALRLITTSQNMDIFTLFEQDSAYYSGTNLYLIIAASAFSAFAMISFVSLCFHGTNHKGFHTFIMAAAFAIRIWFSWYHFEHNELVLYHNAVYNLQDITFSAVSHAAGLLFFFAVFVFAASLKKTEVQHKTISQDIIPNHYEIVQPTAEINEIPDEKATEDLCADSLVHADV